jgi:hypothetical protein
MTDQVASILRAKLVLLLIKKKGREKIGRYIEMERQILDP